MTNQYLHIKSVFWKTSTLSPHSAYQLVVLTSTLLCAVVSMLLAKLYKSALLSPYLAPSLTFMGNTTPEQSEQFRPSVHIRPVRTRRQTCWNFLNSLKVYDSQPWFPPPPFSVVFLIATEHAQSVCVKIAALRDWTDSPFLKFTLVAAQGEWWEFIWHAGASVDLGFPLVDVTVHAQTHTHAHTRTPVAVS